jgi:hypothetical protein
MSLKSLKVLVLVFTLAAEVSVQAGGRSQCSEALAETAARTAETAAPTEKAASALYKIAPETHEFSGLTSDGLKVLAESRDVIRQRDRLFESQFRNLTTIHHMGLVARLFKGNVFLYGPPGGAKSLFVNWLMQGENEAPYRLQLHQMITEQAFIGGQNFEAAKEGRFELNVKGSMADYKLALIDEMDKGNPSVLAALLSLLNERKVLAGGQTFDARLETLFATSNANLPEIFQQFKENGQGSTAPALLNRFEFKAFLYNWLSPEDQAILDARTEKRRYLKSVAETYPDVLKDEVFLEPEKLNWPALRQLAHAIFKPSPLFMNVSREMVNDLRGKTNDAVRESEERHQQNLDEPFVYFPSADLTERLREQITEIVRMSAMIDFLESPLADEANLKALLEKPIELDPLSLWRAYLAMTTVGPGRARLKIDPKAEQKIDIDFGWTVEPSSARDKREELLIQNLKAEQDRFRRTFIKDIGAVQDQIELRARSAGKSGGKSPLEWKSFELMLSRMQGED